MFWKVLVKASYDDGWGLRARLECFGLTTIGTVAVRLSISDSMVRNTNMFALRMREPQDKPVSRCEASLESSMPSMMMLSQSL